MTISIARQKAMDNNMLIKVDRKAKVVEAHSLPPVQTQRVNSKAVLISEQNQKTITRRAMPKILIWFGLNCGNSFFGSSFSPFNIFFSSSSTRFPSRVQPPLIPMISFRMSFCCSLISLISQVFQYILSSMILESSSIFDIFNCICYCIIWSIVPFALADELFLIRGLVEAVVDRLCQCLAAPATFCS